MFLFRAFGRVIESELALPEFEQIDATSGRSPVRPDLRIALAKLPPIPRDERNAEFFRVRDGVIDFEVDDIVRIRIPNAKLIEVDILDPERERDARLFVTGSAFGAWTYLSGRIPFHCGLVTRQGKGFAITGPSGVGKSTLTTALVERDFGFMSDDVVVFDQPNGPETVITPSFARIKLWQDAADHFAIDTTQFSRLHHDMDKYHVPFPQDKIVEQANLAAVFRLKFDDEAGHVVCRRLSHLDSLKELRGNIYRLALVPALNLEQDAFKLISNILMSVPVFEISRPRCFDRFDETIEAFEREVSTLLSDS